MVNVLLYVLGALIFAGIVYGVLRLVKKSNEKKGK